MGFAAKAAHPKFWSEGASPSRIRQGCQFPEQHGLGPAENGCCSAGFGTPNAGAGVPECLSPILSHCVALLSVEESSAVLEQVCRIPQGSVPAFDRQECRCSEKGTGERCEVVQWWAAGFQRACRSVSLRVTLAA